MTCIYSFWSFYCFKKLNKKRTRNYRKNERKYETRKSTRKAIKGTFPQNKKEVIIKMRRKLISRAEDERGSCHLPFTAKKSFISKRL